LDLFWLCDCILVRLAELKAVVDKGRRVSAGREEHLKIMDSFDSFSWSEGGALLFRRSPIKVSTGKPAPVERKSTL